MPTPKRPPGPAPGESNLGHPSPLPGSYDSLVTPAAGVYGSQAAASGYAYQTAHSQQRSLLERSQLAGKVLAVKYDHLNQMIASTEEFFKSLKCPTPAFISYDLLNDEEAGIFEWDVLGFTKFNDKWRIVHGYCNSENHGIFENLQPLADCPISVRVSAASEIEQLYKEIIERKEKFIPEVDNAINEFVKFHQFIDNRKGVQNG
jgi:hypothetical protein